MTQKSKPMKTFIRFANLKSIQIKFAVYSIALCGYYMGDGCAKDLPIGCFDYTANKIWFYNNTNKDYVISLPGNYFNFYGSVKNNEVNVRSMQSREAWLLTMPKKYNPRKQDAITVSDLNDFKNLGKSFILLVRAREYSEKNGTALLGKVFHMSITMNSGTYADLGTPPLNANPTSDGAGK